jgi:hypothetical protein
MKATASVRHPALRKGAGHPRAEFRRDWSERTTLWQVRAIEWREFISYSGRRTSEADNTRRSFADGANGGATAPKESVRLSG